MRKDSTLPRRDHRGGARNSASRESFAITQAQAENLIAATQFAFTLGLPFTRFITLHWKAAGVSEFDMVKATGRFLDLYTKAIARHGCKTAWIYVHENGVSEGWHCHILMHVPKALVEYITKRQGRWIKSITGNPYRKNAIKSVVIGRRHGIEQRNASLHRVNTASTLGYVLKQTSPSTASLLDILHRSLPGSVKGKRVGCSQNIGPQSRRRE